MHCPIAPYVYIVKLEEGLKDGGFLIPLIMMFNAKVVISADAKHPLSYIMSDDGLDVVHDVVEKLAETKTGVNIVVVDGKVILMNPVMGI